MHILIHLGSESPFLSLVAQPELIHPDCLDVRSRSPSQGTYVGTTRRYRTQRHCERATRHSHSAMKRLAALFPVVGESGKPYKISPVVADFPNLAIQLHKVEQSIGSTTGSHAI